MRSGRWCVAQRVEWLEIIILIVLVICRAKNRQPRRLVNIICAGEDLAVAASHQKHLENRGVDNYSFVDQLPFLHMSQRRPHHPLLCSPVVRPFTALPVDIHLLLQPAKQCLCLPETLLPFGEREGEVQDWNRDSRCGVKRLQLLLLGTSHHGSCALEAEADELACRAIGSGERVATRHQFSCLGQVVRGQDFCGFRGGSSIIAA